jgi:tyrosine-protein kinase
MDPQLDEPDLRSYLGVIGRRKWWVVGVTILFFGAAVAMSLMVDPQYRLKAVVQSRSPSDPVALVLGNGNMGLDQNREAENQLAYLNSTDLRFAVLDSCDEEIMACGDTWSVKAQAAGSDNENRNTTSNVVELTLISTAPEGARNVLNLFAETYAEEQRSLEQERLISLTQELSDAISDLNQRIAQADDPQTRDSLEEARDNFQEQVFNLQFSTGIANGGGARVISRASVPDTPISPNIPRNLAIGLVFGLFLGVAVAFLRDYFDDSVKSKDVVERVTGVPALGLIPRFDTKASELVASSAPTAPAAEAFRSLRTSVKFMGVDRDIRVLQVTSPSQGEGKTLIAANLAAVFAQAGDRVVLVGADLRRPRMEDMVGVPLTPGLTGVLIGEVALPQAIRGVEGQPNLSVLPAGHPPPNPSELLSGERAHRLVEVLSQTYDLVILDSPPVLPVSDSLVLAGMADSTLLVASSNRTSRRALDRCVELLDQVGAPLVGAVLTSLAPGATYGGDGYRYESVLTPRHKGKNKATTPPLVPSVTPSSSSSGGSGDAGGNGGDSRQRDFWPEGPVRD